MPTRLALFAPALVALSALASVACGGGRSPEAADPTKAQAGEAPEPAERTEAVAPAERPFAASTAEASSLISEAVDKHQDAVVACVSAFRVRKKLAHERVTISFGIDMEGSLLGVTSKGAEDVELTSCVHDALRDALFPRSHAGVITVTKTYEEILQ